MTLFMNLFERKKLKTYILEKLNQEELIAKVLDISESDVAYCLKDKSNAINNPLRDDKHASLGMMYVIDNAVSLPKIRLHDFASTFYRGDIFDFTGIVFRLNSNDPKDFIEICNLLINLSNVAYPKRQIVKEVRQHLIPTIQYELKELTLKDILYWKHAGIPSDQLTPNRIYAVKYAYLEGKVIYRYNDNDPCYIYLFGIDPIRNIEIVQLYFPFRNKNKRVTRFITNNPYSLNDFLVYPDGTILILTKSYKDEVAIRCGINNCKELKDEDIVIKSVSSETANLTLHDITFLQNNYSYIFTNFDFDYAGTRLAYSLKRTYGIPSLYLTDGRFGTYNYGAKDYSAYYTRFGADKAWELLVEGYGVITNHINNLYNGSNSESEHKWS